MKTVLVGDFIRHFSTKAHEPCQVVKRGKPVGTWTPASKAPPPVDIMARLKTYCAKPLPFTGAELLKEGKKR